MRRKIELQVMGYRKLRPVFLYDSEWEALKVFAKRLGMSISELIGIELAKVNAEINEAERDFLVKIGGIS